MTKEKIIEKLEIVQDPELGIDIWTMGLIYDINIVSDTHIKILMTYTTPVCPVGDQLQQDIRIAMSQLGFEKIDIQVTFDPPWQPSEELRIALSP